MNQFFDKLSEKSLSQEIMKYKSVPTFILFFKELVKHVRMEPSIESFENYIEVAKAYIAYKDVKHLKHYLSFLLDVFGRDTDNCELFYEKILYLYRDILKMLNNYNESCFAYSFNNKMLEIFGQDLYKKKEDEEKIKKIKAKIKKFNNLIEEQLTEKLNFYKNKFSIFDDEMKVDINKKDSLLKNLEALPDSLSNNDDLITDNEKYYIVSKIWAEKYDNFIKYVKENIDKEQNYRDFIKVGFELNASNNIFIGEICNYPLLDLSQNLIEYEDDSSSKYILKSDAYIKVPIKVYEKLKDFFGVDYEISKVNDGHETMNLNLILVNKIFIDKIPHLLNARMIQVNKNISCKEFVEIIKNYLENFGLNFKEEMNKIKIYKFLDSPEPIYDIQKQEFLFLLALHYGANSYPLNVEELSVNDLESFCPFIKDKDHIILAISAEELITLPNKSQCYLCKKSIKYTHKTLRSELFPAFYCSEACLKKDKLNDVLGKIVHKFSKKEIQMTELQNMEVDYPEECQKGLTGLVNIGNTCFMNSALQCLSNCFMLTKYFLTGSFVGDVNVNNKLGSQGRIANAYKHLIDQLWFGEERYLSPTNFKRIFSHFVQRFSGFSQQDSNEFLTFILDKLHEDLNRITEKPYLEIENKRGDESEQKCSERFWRAHKAREDSMIVDLFHGQFKSRITCLKCEKESVCFDPFMFIPLPIPSGRYELTVKYFGLESFEFQTCTFQISQNTTSDEVKRMIAINILKKDVNLSASYSVKSTGSSKSKKRKSNRNKRKRIEEEQNYKEIELVVLNKDLKIEDILTDNDYIFNYVQNGYEIVAYQNSTNSDNENSYIYLMQYKTKYFIYLFGYNNLEYIFKYPIAFSINMQEDLIEKLYSKIDMFLNKIPNNNASKINIDEGSMAIDLRIKGKKEDENLMGHKDNFKLYMAQSNNNSFCRVFFSKKKADKNVLDLYNIKEPIRNIRKNGRYIFNLDLSDSYIFSPLEEFPPFFTTISTDSGTINLLDCLRLFNSEEKLENENNCYCSNCKEHTNAFKKIDLYRTPYYLIIQLKRFKQGNCDNYSMLSMFSSGKNTVNVHCPIDLLDISEYVSDTADKTSCKYKLIGVINHFGTMSFGHYTANCLNNGVWYNYNDETVSKINKEKVVTNSAYVLFYQKMESN